MLFKKVPRGAKIFEANIAKICGKDLSKYYFPVRYDSRVVIYERKMFKRLATDYTQNG